MRSAAPRRSAWRAWGHKVRHHPSPVSPHIRSTQDLGPGVMSLLTFPTQASGMWNKPISHPRKFGPIPEALPTLPHLGLPLPTCSWPILFWADAQGPRPRSRSRSRRPSPNRHRARLSCSASNTSWPELRCWGIQETGLGSGANQDLAPTPNATPLLSFHPVFISGSAPEQLSPW